MIAGVKFMAKVLKVTFLVTYVFFFAFLVWLAVLPPNSLYPALLAAGKDPGGMINTAVSNGYVSGWTFLGTMFLMAYAFNTYAGYWFSVYMGGEVKEPKRSALWGIIGSLVVSGIIIVIYCFLVYRVYGYDLWNSIAFLGANVPSAYAFTVPSWVNYFAVYINPWLGFIASLSFVAAVFYVMPSMFVPIRNIMTWAYDKLLPEKLAEVSERTHTPIYASILSGALIWLFTALTAYTNFWGYLVNLVLGMGVTFFIFSIAAILLPYRKKKMYEDLPMSRYKVLGIPAVVPLAILTVITWGWAFYSAATSPAIGGPVSYTSILSIALIFIVAIGIYAVAYYVNKRRGLDLKILFKDVPPV
jgi:amino acid transporter